MCVNYNMNGKIVNRKIITQNLYAGEKALKTFKAEFPYFHSNTKINTAIRTHEDNKRYSDLIPRLRKQSIVTGLKINNLRLAYASIPNKIQYLTQNIKFNKAANCCECSFLIHDTLKQQGVESQNVIMNIFKNGEERFDRNHAFTVIGLKKDANISNPKTWGKHAVIVDGWANIVKRAKEGLDYFTELFGFNSETEHITLDKYRNI